MRPHNLALLLESGLHVGNETHVLARRLKELHWLTTGLLGRDPQARRYNLEPEMVADLSESDVAKIRKKITGITDSSPRS